MIGHQTAEAMARCLVGYIPCDRRVLSAIHEEFDRAAISLEKIDQIRRLRDWSDARTRRGRIGGVDFENRGWDWRGDQYRDQMARASDRYVSALALEKAGAR